MCDSYEGFQQGPLPHREGERLSVEELAEVALLCIGCGYDCEDELLRSLTQFLNRKIRTLMDLRSIDLPILRTHVFNHPGRKFP